MEARKNFDEFFRDDLSKVLDPLEQTRKKISRVGTLSYVVTAAAIIALVITISNQGGIMGVFAALLIIWAIIALYNFSNKKKDYVSAFKGGIIHPIIKFIDPNLSYDPGRFIHENDYEKSGLFLQKQERYTGDDYVEGKRDKTFFSFSELHTQYEAGSGKSKHWERIFKGLFFIGDFNKNFHGRTYAWSENNPQLNFLSKIFSSFAAGLEKVKLEDPEFERRFIVYSSDQVEARYILSPSMMERMVKLRDMMGPEFCLSFVDTNVYVAVPISDELFEPSVFSANDHERLRKYYNTVHVVFDIIDELKLNLRIWNKA